MNELRNMNFLISLKENEKSDEKNTLLHMGVGKTE